MHAVKELDGDYLSLQQSREKAIPGCDVYWARLYAFPKREAYIRSHGFVCVRPGICVVYCHVCAALL